MSAERDVAAYYDSNTASFTKTGQGATSIRRALWAPGVTQRADAFRVIDQRVLAAINEMPEQRNVLDLGSGVGSSLLWLRERAEFDGTGVTLSEEQARWAADAFRATTRLTSLNASYTALPDSVRDVGLAFAIESFAHAPSVEAFLTPIASRLRSGGRLLICDDFLGPNHAAYPKLISDFRWGWVAASLVEPAHVIEIARTLGLENTGNEDFTEFIELGRPRDHLLDVVVAIGKPFNPKGWLFRSWVGGTALQSALKKRAMEHRLLTFVKK